MADNYITIGDLQQVIALADTHKLLIDDSTGGDTKSAQVSVLKNYLTDKITPHINKTTMTWFVGDIDTGVSVESGGGIDIWTAGEDYKVDDFVCYKDMIYRCIVSPQVDVDVFSDDEWASMASKIEFASEDDIEDMINTVWEVDKNE